MTTRKYVHWFSLAVAALCASVGSVLGDCQNYMATSCTNSDFYTGCTRGTFTVMCQPSGTNCAWTGGCYQVTVVGGSCGDCCVNIPGCGMNCKYTSTNNVPVTVIQGTASCPSNCTGPGSCINVQPLPGNWTWPVYEATDHACGG